MKDNELKPNTRKILNNDSFGIKKEKVGDKKFTVADFLEQTKKLNKGVYGGGIAPPDVNIMNKKTK